MSTMNFKIDYNVIGVKHAFIVEYKLDFEE